MAVALSTHITSNAAAVQRRLDALTTTLTNPANQTRALGLALASTVMLARTNAPKHTGRLAASIGQIPQVGAVPTVIIRTSLPHSWMRERGTAGLPGGVLRPRRARMLRWVDYSGVAHAAFAVTQEGDHYMERAYEQTRHEIPAAFTKYLLWTALTVPPL